MTENKTYDFGLIGLGVMGRNFILNVADHEFSALGMDLDQDKVNALKSEGGAKDVDGTTDISDFVNRLKVPRKIMLLVPAGDPVDNVIEDLLPFINKGDIIIDGGNSFFRDTDRRQAYLDEKGIYLIGAGVSGGAKGARLGPSIMPGGNFAAYVLIKPIFEAVAAKVGEDPCVDYMGEGSAGNYVKMVHNGIEYGMMQLISEIYQIMKKGMGYSNEQIQETFELWNQSRLQSFLVEITAKIFKKRDEEGDKLLVDLILDKAKQKGTGKWTSQNAMDIGIPIPTIDSAVTMRELSALKDLRVEVDELYDDPGLSSLVLLPEELEKTLYFGFIMAYAQGMHQLDEASNEYEYDFDLAVISKIWRGGCIIRSAILEHMKQAYEKNPELINLITDEYFKESIEGCIHSVRKVLCYAVESGLPMPSTSSALSYFDTLKRSRLPLNLIQAQRDFFGSHTYERIDKPGKFHTEWE